LTRASSTLERSSAVQRGNRLVSYMFSLAANRFGFTWL
jgi:hypothetical protein